MGLVVCASPGGLTSGGLSTSDIVSLDQSSETSSARVATKEKGLGKLVSGTVVALVGVSSEMVFQRRVTESRIDFGTTESSAAGKGRALSQQGRPLDVAFLNWAHNHSKL